LPHNENVFRLNFDWWVGYDLASVKLAYIVESGKAEEEAFDEEQKFPRDAVKTECIKGGPWLQ
jgi:hypothetical protein